MLKITTLVIGLVFLSGCTTTAPMGRLMKLDPQQKTQCIKHCKELDMELGAFVIIANMTGCVCEPIKTGKTISSKTISDKAVAVLGGMIANASSRAKENQAHTNASAMNP